MALSADLTPWLRLSLTPGMSGESLRRLLVAFGSPEQVLGAAATALQQVVPRSIAQAIQEGVPGDRLEAVADWLEDPANHVVTLADAEYPQALLQTPDAPPILYAKGRLDLLNHRAIAIVGSRNATAQGLMTAESFAHALSDAGFTIVSGLALGVDAAAHRGGLAGTSRSVAVVGTGLDLVYPARNRTLAQELARDGALISDFPLATPALAANFPRRNRLISGLAQGCLVVEAALSSGSLITARLANEQGKDVFAIPGSIHSPLSKGCHVLIKQGAKLVDSVQDILEELQLSIPANAPGATSSPPVHRLLEIMGFDPCDIDTLATRSGLAADAIAALLTQFELDGSVAALPGGRYQRIR
jgi:DNA processing protein